MLKLRGRIVEKGLTIEQVARKMSIDRSTLYRKLQDGGTQFTILEAKRLCEILALSGSEAAAVFFDHPVAPSATSER